MPLQRGESDNDSDSVDEMPVVLPKYTVSQAKLYHLEKARARKAEIAKEKAEERARQRDETIALSKGVKQVKDPASREIIKKEVLKATALRQAKITPPLEVSKVATPHTVGHKTLQDESEPEVIFVKRPKKKIVIEESDTESETEPVRPIQRSQSRKKPVQNKKHSTSRKVATDTETEYDSEDNTPPPPRMRRQPSKPHTAYIPPRFQINF